MELHKEQFLDDLKRYLEIPSPAGYTDQCMDALKKDFKETGFQIIETNKGAFILCIPGEDESQIRMITAHVDTLGGIVKAITPSGRLRYHKLGGGSYQATEGENCTVFTLDGKAYRGSAVPDHASTHIYGDLARTVQRNEENVSIRLDEKVFSAQDVHAIGIEVGDIIAFDTRFEFTEKEFIKTRYIDNKACVIVLLHLARYFAAAAEKPKHPVHFYFTNYEEVSHGVSHVDPKVSEIVALDIGTVGGNQQSDEYSVCIAAKDNKGPYDYSLRKRLTLLCREHEIPYKVDVYNRYGSDASAAVHQGRDVRHACIGPGVDATHHYERTHWESMMATSNLVYRYLKS